MPTSTILRKYLPESCFTVHRRFMQHEFSLKMWRLYPSLLSQLFIPTRDRYCQHGPLWVPGSRLVETVIVIIIYTRQQHSKLWCYASGETPQKPVMMYQTDVNFPDMFMHSVFWQSLLRSSVDMGKSVLIWDYPKLTLIASGCINKMGKKEVI